MVAAQNSDSGLALTAYVKVDTHGWLKMYSRLYHGCDLEACRHLPTPALLTVATSVNSMEDMGNSEGIGDDARTTTLAAAREMRNNLAIGGSPDAAAMGSQPTILCSDFEM